MGALKFNTVIPLYKNSLHTRIDSYNCKNGHGITLWTIQIKNNKRDSKKMAPIINKLLFRLFSKPIAGYVPTSRFCRYFSKNQPQSVENFSSENMRWMQNGQEKKGKLNNVEPVKKTVHVQIVSAQIVSGTNCIGTNCIGTICIGTIYIGHKLYRAQTVSGTNCIGHKLYRAQIVSGFLLSQQLI